MKERLEQLNSYFTEDLKDIIKVPYEIDSSYFERTLTVRVTNLKTGKSYLMAYIRGKERAGNTFIELFYIMPHFQNRGYGHKLLDFYSRLQKDFEGKEIIMLKPIPFLPESKNLTEYFRLYTWLGKKEHMKMTRRQLIRFYKSAGFEPVRPDDLNCEMQRDLTLI